MRGGQPFPYDVLTVPGDGRSRSVARIECTRCGSREEWTISGPHNPEKACKAFRAAGWECDWSHPTRRTCPACIAKHAAKRAGERPDPKVIMLQPKQQGTNMAEPTQDQRLKIRALLDANFDDSKGFYLAGYSDQKIGGEVNVPWAVVQKIREAAYGPIKGDPEVEAIKASIAALEREIAALRGRVEAIDKRFRSAS